MDDEHIRVARWMRRVEPGEVDDSDGEEPFPLLDVDDFGNDGDATDESGSEARSDGGRLPGAIRGFGAVLDENGNPNGWFGPTGQFKRGVADGEQGATVEETDDATNSGGLGEDAGRIGHAPRVFDAVLYDPESNPAVGGMGSSGEETDVQALEGQRDKEDDTDPVGGEEMETNVPTATTETSIVVMGTRTNHSRTLHIEALNESTEEEDGKELTEGKEIEMKTPTITHVEHVKERPPSPLKRKRLD